MALSCRGMSSRRSSGWFWSSAADVALNRRQPKTLALLSILLVSGDGRLAVFSLSVVAENQMRGKTYWLVTMSSRALTWTRRRPVSQRLLVLRVLFLAVLLTLRVLLRQDSILLTVLPTTALSVSTTAPAVVTRLAITSKGAPAMETGPRHMELWTGKNLDVIGR